MNLYALKDKTSGLFGQVLMGLSHAMMVRQIREQLEGSGNTVDRFPEDFSLYLLGRIDDDGHLIPEPQPEKIQELSNIWMKREVPGA